MGRFDRNGFTGAPPGMTTEVGMYLHSPYI
jgi:hypothetical protein